MYVRCAYFQGEVAPADRERFDRFMDEEIMPRLVHMPKVRAIRLLRGRQFQDDCPRFYQTVEQDYDSLADTRSTNSLCSGCRRPTKCLLVSIRRSL